MVIARLKSGIRALVGIGLHAVYRLLALGGALQALYMKRRGDAEASAAVRASSLRVPAGPGPYTFIPRDAGFFSVFNFIAGDLYDGRRVYPLFELEEYLKYRSENRHFAYFGPRGTNSWFDYFQPIRFGEDDEGLHQNREYLKTLPFTDGQLGPPEFRVPDISRQLYSRADFQQWRQAVHDKVCGAIGLTDELQARVQHTLTKMPGRKIGVHVRHPSHMVEQGKVLYGQYFVVLDRLVRDHAPCSIFLATDNEMALAVFQFRYGDTVRYNKDVLRSSADDVLRWAYALAEGRPDAMGFVDGVGFQSHYRVAAQADYEDGAGLRAGKEAVVDLFTLAGCDDFICTISNFTLACSYLNPQQVQHLISPHGASHTVRPSLLHSQR